MIWLGLGLLVSVLFGGPAVAAVVRREMTRRRQAAEAHRKEEEGRRQRARDAQQHTEYIWRNSPDRAGVGEYLRYLVIKAPLEQAAAEAGRRLEQHSTQVERCLSGYPGHKPPSTRYRLVVLTGLVFFLGVLGLAIMLDFLIFRGLHPTGTALLPLGLASVAVLGITVGSVIMFGARRHDLLPHDISDYYRQVIILGGALLALFVAGYMIAIAPNRSAPAGQAAITRAEQVLQADQSAVPPSSPQLISVDQQAVTQARANLARAQQVDRLSAGALAIVEIPLSEAAVLGGELLVLYLAIARRERARHEQQRAKDVVAQADARFVAELTQILINHGHNEESVRRIVHRVNAMNASANGSMSPGGADGLAPDRGAPARDRPSGCPRARPPGGDGGARRAAGPGCTWGGGTPGAPHRRPARRPGARRPGRRRRASGRSQAGEPADGRPAARDGHHRQPAGGRNGPDQMTPPAGQTGAHSTFV